MRRGILLLPFLLPVTGCDSPTRTEGPPDGGTFELVALDGEPLPVDRAPWPPSRQVGSECRMVFTEGFFALDAARLRYSYHYDVVSSCDGRLVDRVESDGAYVPGPQGYLTDPAHGPLPSAVIQGDTLFRRTSDGMLAYSNRRPPIGMVVGTFHFRRVEGVIGTACEPVVAGGLLTLSLDSDAPVVSGAYRLETRSEDPCTGETTDREESGTYEQVDHLLGFRTTVGPNEFFLFRGEIRADEIALLRGGGGSDLVFGL